MNNRNRTLRQWRTDVLKWNRLRPELGAAQAARAIGLNVDILARKARDLGIALSEVKKGGIRKQ